MDYGLMPLLLKDECVLRRHKPLVISINIKMLCFLEK